MKITLAPDLERALLRSIAEGVQPPSIVQPDELSKKAKAIHGALVYLIKRGAKPPLKPASIMLAANSLYGFPKSSAEAFLRSFKEFQTGEEIATIVQAAREKSALASLINAAGEQLSTGVLDTGVLARALAESSPKHNRDVVSLAERVGDKFTSPPHGLDLLSLPEITNATNGLSGIWVIGGEPGLGKSTLAMQIAIDAAARTAVDYYDIDGTGEAYFIDRLRQIFGGNISKFRKATTSFRYHETIEDIDAHTQVKKNPGLLVIDSIQTLPVLTKWSKESMDDWLRRFKGLIQIGYTLLLVSEKARSQYGQAELGGYKGTGDIEYSGTLCAHVLADEDDDSVIRFIIVKNRHGPMKGHVVNLLRDDEKVFWFKEEKIKTYVDRKQKRKSSRG